jgi:hypothetical protein
MNNMNKFYFIPVFILTGIVFQFSSCDEKSYTVTIENQSSKTVYYKYNNEEVDYLGSKYDANNSKVYIVRPYTQPPKDINVNGVMSIKMLSQNGNFTFVDIEESEIITLNVNNTLPIEIVLRADKYIDDLNGSTEMRIQPYEPKAGRIYTATPIFILFPSQYTVDWNFNEERTAIFVVIR